MKRILSLLIAYFVFISQALAVVNVPDSQHWVPAGYGGGGSFPMTVPDHFTDGKVYMVSDVGAPLVTTDRGDNWTWLSYNSLTGYNVSIGAALVQSKNNANLMYTIGGGASWERGILKSTNGGQKWTLMTRAYGASRTASGRVLAFDPTDDNKLYVGTNNGTLARTTDGGSTWTNLATNIFGTNNIIRWIYVNPTGTKVFMGNKNWAAGGGGVKVYDVGSGVITSVPIEPTTVSSYAVYKNNSSDFGTFIDGSLVENLCVTAGIQIACTADEGATWTYTADATSPATYSGNARYINKFAVKRLASGQLRFIVSLQFDRQDGTSGSFVRVSSNSGVTWSTSSFTRNYTVNPTFIGTSDPVVGSIREDPFDETIYYLTTNFTHWRSDNSGSTFVEKVSGAQQVVANEVIISPNGTIIVCHMDIGCQKSTNNGTTWTNMVPKYPFSESGVAYPGGHFWRVITTGTKEDWDAGNGHIIATSNYWYDRKPRIHRSVDNGATWTTITSGLPTDALWGDCVWGTSGCYFRGLSVSKIDENIIYGAMDGTSISSSGDGGLFKSTDNGVTWSRVWATPNRVYNALAVDPIDVTAQKLLLGTTTYNLYQKTGASTANFVGDSFGPGNSVWDVAYDSVGRPYAGTSYNGPTIFKSVITDYGNGTGQYGTWREMKRFWPGGTSGSGGFVDAITIDPTNNNRIFIGIQNSGQYGEINGNRVFVTNNASAHDQSDWYDITGDLPAQFGCQSMAVNPIEGTRGFLYCATPGNGVFKLDLQDSISSSSPGRTVIGGTPLR